tara:strand:- start:21 stop:569 length:549 start_codon:yes stop_codon:yes gene_type:complete
MNTFNFIEKYKVPLNLCDTFISYHKKNIEYKTPGKTGLFGKVDPIIKDSVDVTFYNGSQEPFIRDFFKELTKAALHFANKYSFNNHFESDVLHLIQYYPPAGGYFKRHYERSSLDVCRRQVVYMLYCNNLKKGGTEFPFQNKKLKAIKGDLYLWPADFTHPHQGVISKDEEKYIVTGWFNII